MIPSTVARMPEHTADDANEAIRRHTHENVARSVAGGHGRLTPRGGCSRCGGTTTAGMR